MVEFGSVEVGSVYMLNRDIGDPYFPRGTIVKVTEIADISGVAEIEYPIRIYLYNSNKRTNTVSSDEIDEIESLGDDELNEGI